MSFRTLRLPIGILLLAVSFVLLALTAWPAARAQNAIASQFGPIVGAAPGVEGAALEPRLLTVEYPRWIRTGDSNLVRMTFEVDPRPPAEGIPVDVPDLYDTHNLVLEARLDLAGMQVAPAGAISEPIRRGQAVTFYWSVSPIQPGTYRGNLWVYLNMVPKEGGEVDRRALVASRIEIEGRSVLGLPAGLARWVAAGGAVLGFVFSMPFIEDILRRLWARIRKNRARTV